MSINKHSSLIPVAGCLLMAVLIGAERSAAQGRLASVTSVRCEFTLRATGTWKNGVPQTDVKPVKVSVGFNSVDTQDGTAEALAQFGDSPIIVRLSGPNLHFLDIDSSGRLFVTTIFDRDSLPGKMQAAHTRHEYTEGSLPRFTSRAEQYYGDCAVER
jgi:hypothetical protein